MIYYPDNWVVLRIYGPQCVYHKVLAGWAGGYTQGGSWKLNSGITKVVDDGDRWLFHGFSGSLYSCHKEMYRITLQTSSIFTRLERRYEGKIFLLDEETDWINLELGDEEFYKLLDE